MRTIFDANPDGGVVAIAMTPDAKYLATLSCGETQVSTHILPKLSYFLQKIQKKFVNVVFRSTLISFVQMLSIWDWTVEAEAPLCTAELDASYGVQNYLLFNQEDTTQLVSNSESQVIFYSWVSAKSHWLCPVPGQGLGPEPEQWGTIGVGLCPVQMQCERFYIIHTTHSSMSRSQSLSRSRRQPV